MSELKDSSCILCDEKFFFSKYVPLNERLVNDDTPGPTLYQFIQTISDFNQLNIEDIQGYVCVICYQSAQLTMNFQTTCNKSAERLRKCLEEAKKGPAITIDKDAIDLTGQASPCGNAELNENEESGENLTTIENENAKKNDSDDSLSDLEEAYFRRLDNPSKEEIMSDYFARYNEKIECKVCDEVYIQRDKEKHYKTHVAPYECKTCHKTYNKALTLIRHKETHEPAKFLCSFCGLCFRSIMALKTHIFRHTNTRPFVCEVCDSRFRCKQRLKNHISIHTGEKPFMCPVCGKRFRLDDFLQQHMVVHAKVKPIQCKFCGRRFTQKHALRSHVAKSCKGYKDDENEYGENEHGEDVENEDDDGALNEDGEDVNEKSSAEDDNMDG